LPAFVKGRKSIALGNLPPVISRRLLRRLSRCGKVRPNDEPNRINGDEDLREMKKKSVAVSLALLFSLAACGGGMSAQDYADKYGGTASDYEDLVGEDRCNMLQAFLDLAGTGTRKLAVEKRMEEVDC
jgi:hypothetical protein